MEIPNGSYAVLGRQEAAQHSQVRRVPALVPARARAAPSLKRANALHFRAALP